MRKRGSLLLCSARKVGPLVSVGLICCLITVTWSCLLGLRFATASSTSAATLIEIPHLANHHVGGSDDGGNGCESDLEMQSHSRAVKEIETTGDEVKPAIRHQQSDVVEPLQFDGIDDSDGFGPQQSESAVVDSADSPSSHLWSGGDVSILHEGIRCSQKHFVLNYHHPRRRVLVVLQMPRTIMMSMLGR